MQHFITDSQWDARNVMDKAALRASKELPKKRLTGLLIDETGIEKKGEKSVGVGWQYCGNVGKTANSQVAVLGSLSNGDFSSLIDARLYLPKSWTENKERCEEGGIPEGTEFKTKPELAYEIIKHQHELGVDFDFVGGDGLYGNDIELAHKIEDLGYLYMMDIHKDQTIYLEEPELKIPEKRGKRGRKPFLPKPNKGSIRVDNYQKELSHEQWTEIKIRNTAKGYLKAKFHFAQVFIWDKVHGTIEKRLLVIRKHRTKKGVEIKYSFTNASLEQHDKKAIAYMQAQRFFVEHSIKESKQVLGLSQFQTRKWQAWQHQVALNIMTACFMLEEKLFCFDDLPLLSAWDIKEWICYKLYKHITDEDMIERIYIRHLLRQMDINRAYSKEKISNVSK